MTNKQEHPHAKWLRAIADGETLQGINSYSSTWQDMSLEGVLGLIASNRPSTDIRIKPNTITIGRYEVAEPMREAPDNGKRYWFVSFRHCGSVDYYDWLGDSTDYRLLAAGMCWSNEEDARLAAKAITELLLK